MTQDFHSTSHFTAERYLLGELTANEREQFEEHYFSCPECANSVLAGAAFLDNSRAVLPQLDTRAGREFAAAIPAKPLFAWLSWSFAPQAAFACLALLAVFAGYQNAVEIPRLRAQSAGGGLSLSTAPVLTARRAASDLTLSAKAPSSAVIVPNEWEEKFPAYTSEIQNEANSQILAASTSTPEGGSFVISVPSAHLGAGKYLIMLYGVPASGPRQIVGRFPLTIQN